MSLRSVAVVLACALVSLPVFAALNHPSSITAEAEGPAGRIVGFTVTVAGGNDGSDGRPADTVTCSPPSLSLFPIGTTTVSCTGSEGSTGSFPVNVVDTTPPALSLPRDFNVVTTSPSGQPVTYSASATDIVDGSVAVSCAPSAGSAFPLGTTRVNCSASDSRGNTGSGFFDVTLTTTPGTNPYDITAEATGPDGARVTFSGGDEDEDGRPGSGGCSPAPGTTFPLGATTVTCPSGNFTVTVVDTTPPALNVSAGITAVATSPAGAVVTYGVTASDLVDGSVAVSCSPSSGSTFVLGTTTVNCSASDSRSNSASASFQVIVLTEPPEPPDPDDIVAEATSAAGAVVTFDLGNDGGGRPIACAPPSGSTFALGGTTVQCDGSISFTITVVDTTPPVLTLPADMTLHAVNAAGAAGTFTATASDLVDGSVPVVCTPPSGSTFALGTTTVLCTATDAHDNESSGSFLIHVIDVDPPTIVSLSASPSSIWPPNKNMIDVTVTANVIDNVDAAPLVRIYAITCDETIAASDAVITGPLTAKLRADRDGNGDGRVYTLHIEAIDAAGNRSTRTVTVSVTHDQSSRRRSVRG
ncbi:MAG: HYR domain-containing protein [Acidobacteriota bacterium]|nr:HYR domain-containing protein [Acidobacteriota bacterium]